MTGNTAIPSRRGNGRRTERRDPSPSTSITSKRTASDDEGEPWDETPSNIQNNKKKGNDLVSMVAGTMNCGWMDDEEEELEDGDLPSLGRNRRSPVLTKQNVLLDADKKTTRPLKTPSKAGMVEPKRPRAHPDLDSPRTWEKKQEFWSQLDPPSPESVSYESQFDDDGPDDEMAARSANYVRREQESAPPQQDEVTLDTTDVERVESDDMDADCFQYTLASLGEMCGTAEASPPRVKRDAEEGSNVVEEQTAIEVEYVGNPGSSRSSEAALTWSPSQKNAYLAAMARKARKEFEKKEAKGKREDQSPASEVNAVGEGQDVNDLYNSLSPSEKRKFLKLINTGLTPTESLHRVLKERENANKSQTLSDGRRSRFSFWKRNKKERSKSQDQKSSRTAAAGKAEMGTDTPPSARRSRSVETPRKHRDRNAAIATAGAAAAAGTAVAVATAGGSDDVAEHARHAPHDAAMYTESPRHKAKDFSQTEPIDNEAGEHGASLEVAQTMSSLEAALAGSPSDDSGSLDAVLSPDSNSQALSGGNQSHVVEESQANQKPGMINRTGTAIAAGASAVVAVGAGAAAAVGSGHASSAGQQGSDGAETEQEGTILDDDDTTHGTFEDTGVNYYDAVRKDIPEEDQDNDDPTPALARMRAARAARTAKYRSPRNQGFSSLHDSQNGLSVRDDLSSAKSSRGRKLSDDDVRSATISPKRQLFGIPIPGSNQSRFAALEDDHVSEGPLPVNPTSQGYPSQAVSGVASAAVVGGALAGASKFTPDENVTSLNRSGEDPITLSIPKANNEGEHAEQIEKELLRPVIVDKPEEDDESEIQSTEFASRQAAGVDEVDTSIDGYMDAATIHSYNNNNHDQMSVVSGKSAWTAASSVHTQSSRKRHHGAARSRIAKAKKSNGTSSSKGWHESIREAASKNQRLWDPARGWVDYEDASAIPEMPPSSKSSDRLNVSIDKTVLGRHRDQQPGSGDSRSAKGERIIVPFPKQWEAERAAMLGSGSVDPSQKRPDGLVESMKAATVGVDTGDNNRDADRGSVGRDDSTSARRPSPTTEVSSSTSTVLAGTAIAATATVAAIASRAVGGSDDGTEKNDKSPLNTFMDKSTKTERKSEQSTEASDQAVASNGGAEKYMQLGDNGSVRSVAQDGAVVKASSSHSGDLKALAGKVASKDAPSISEDEKAPLLTSVPLSEGNTRRVTPTNATNRSSYSGFSGPVDVDDIDDVDSDEDKAPAVEVVKEKCDEDDYGLFARDDQVELTTTSYFSSSVSSHRGRGPVDLDEIEDMTSDEDMDDPSWAPDSFMEGKVSTEMFDKPRKIPLPKSTPPKLEKNRRDTSPVRERCLTATDETAGTAAIVAGTAAAAAIAGVVYSSPGSQSKGEQDENAQSVRTDQSESGSSVKVRAKKWESMTNSPGKTESHVVPGLSTVKGKDEDSPEVSWPDSKLPYNKEQSSAGTAEWKSFLGKKVVAESAAAADKRAGEKGSSGKRREPEGVRGSSLAPKSELDDVLRHHRDQALQRNHSYEDTIFDFGTDAAVQTSGARTASRAIRNVSSPGDDFSDLSPIPQKNDDSHLELLSDSGTAVEQGSFMKRLQACAAPIMPRRSSGSAGNAVPSSHLAFLRTNPSTGTGTDGSRSASRFVPPALCGRPDTITEDDDDAVDTPKSHEKLNRERLAAHLAGITKSGEKRSKSTPRASRRVDSDNRSVSSEDFGARTSYLDAIAMKTAVSKSRRSERKKSASSDISSGSNRTSEKWQAFLDKRGSDGSSPTTSGAQSSTEVSKAAEKYAAEKLEVMMAAMSSRSMSASRRSKGSAGSDNDQVDQLIDSVSAGSSAASQPQADAKSEASVRSRASTKSKKKSESAKAAEELAAARVEAMMAAMTSQTLDEGEI